MAKIDLESLLKFETLLHSFALIERVAHVRGRQLRENDAEHSYFLTMLAWYANESFGMNLDTAKVIRYALVHDLVEVYAGDTYIFDEEAKKTKHEREAKAQIAEEFPDFPSLNEAIAAYELQNDAESQFVKALDKIEPFLANYLSKGRTWKETNVSFEQIRDQKREKVAHHPEIRELLEEMLARIEPNKREYFSK